MPRAKKAADVITALRKRANRRIASLEKAGYRSQAAYLQNLLNESYMGQQLPGRDREQVLKDLEKWAKPQPRTAQERRNLQFQTEMRMAAAGFPTDKFGDAAAAKVKVFWAATRDIWGGKPNAERVQAVLAKLKVTSLEEAYRIVMQQQAGAYYEVYAEAMGTTSEGWTDESPEFEQALSEAEMDQKGGTLTYQSVRR